MSELIDKDKARDLGMDVFNMKPGPRPDNAASQGDGATSGARVEGSGWALKVGPGHFFVVAVLIAWTWIGWPYMSGGSAASSQLATSSQVLRPSESRTEPTSARLAPPNATTSKMGHAVRGPAPMAAPGPVPAVMPASMPAQSSAREMELQTTVAELQSKLASAEARAEARTPPAQATVAEPKTSRKAQSKLHDMGRSRRVVATRVDPDAGPTLHDYTLNTIYRNQAWIQDAERTHVVRAGDVIRDLRIVSIDPRARQVVTSRGVIR